MDAAEGGHLVKEVVLTGGAFALASLMAFAGTQSVPSRAFALMDDFERGIRVSRLGGAPWAVKQEVRGTLDTISLPGHGNVLRARAGAKTTGVGKAALIARPAPVMAGQTVTVAFDLHIPRTTPANSLQIVDVECATCGEGGNPGVRLYLRRGRLRIDRSKIGVEHAWTRDAAPQLARGRWHRIALTLRLGDERTGAARVTLDGREVLAAKGATLLPGADHVDRVQIGVTANSNAMPATLYFDNVAIRAR